MTEQYNLHDLVTDPKVCLSMKLRLIKNKQDATS